MKARLVLLAALPLTMAAGQAAKTTPAKPAAPVSVPAPTTAGCLLVSNAFANGATEDKDKKVAEAALYFFMGRIDERTTSAQLKAQIEQQEHTITNDNAGPLMDACLKLVAAKSQLLASTAPKPPPGK